MALEYAMREAYLMQAAATGTHHLIRTTFVTNLILPGNCNTGQTLDVTTSSPRRSGMEQRQF